MLKGFTQRNPEVAEGRHRQNVAGLQAPCGPVATRPASETAPRLSSRTFPPRSPGSASRREHVALTGLTRAFIRGHSLGHLCHTAHPRPRPRHARRGTPPEPLVPAELCCLDASLGLPGAILAATWRGASERSVNRRGRGPQARRTETSERSLSTWIQPGLKLLPLNFSVT